MSRFTKSLMRNYRLPSTYRGLDQIKQSGASSRGVASEASRKFSKSLICASTGGDVAPSIHTSKGRVDGNPSRRRDFASNSHRRIKRTLRHIKRKNKKEQKLNQNIRFILILNLFVILSITIEISEPTGRIVKELNQNTLDALKLPNRDQIILHPEIEEQRIKDEINSVVNDIFQTNKALLKDINKILIATEDLAFITDLPEHCSDANILGAYYNDTIIIKDSGKLINEHTLYHEVGHNVWNQLTIEQKKEWIALFSKTNDFVTPYAKTNPNENFAENFACYNTNIKNCKEKMMIEKIEFIDKVIES